MTPEARARETVDRKLDAAGWSVQDLNRINLGAARGVAVREYPTDTGPADYVLFVDRVVVGVIKAKRDEKDQIITVHEEALRRNILKAVFSSQLVLQEANGEPASAFLKRIRPERAPADGFKKALARKPRSLT